MRRFRLLLPVFAFALGALAGACSSSDAGGACTASSDCDRGLSCQPDGTCGQFACGSNSDCLQQDAFQETCLQEGADGAYDASAQGYCSDQECTSDRDCEVGETCVNSACYNGTAAPSGCECRDDCPAGQACLRGECAAPASACNDTCECAMGTVCEEGVCVDGTDPCEGVTCDAGESCVEGDCVAAGNCDPACGAGEVCDPATDTCVPAGSSSTLCSTCDSDDDCGGDSDACIAIGAEQAICGQSCGDAAPCPDGYTCYPIDTRVGSQCIPSGGQCTGCLVTPCPAGQFCDPTTTACADLGEVCDACSADAECPTGTICGEYGGSSLCLQACSPGDDCGEGFSCTDLGGRDACAPSGGGCGGTGCDLAADDCVEPLPVLDNARCICVGCVDDGDCPEGRTCTSGGNCVAGGRPCSTTAECDGGYCQGGFCVDCLTPGDCAPEEICVAGACESCDCAPGERCNAAGECIEVPDPSECTSDSQCVNIARELGYSGDGATCDSEIGCYTIGTCNGAGAGIPGLEDIDLGLGGESDPFNAPCPAGTACTGSLDLLGMMSGSFISFSCAGCDETNPDACREGETCAAPLFDIAGTGPVCGSGGGGIPGLPF